MRRKAPASSARVTSPAYPSCYPIPARHCSLSIATFGYLGPAPMLCDAKRDTHPSRCEQPLSHENYCQDSVVASYDVGENPIRSSSRMSKQTCTRHAIGMTKPGDTYEATADTHDISDNELVRYARETSSSGSMVSYTD